MGGSIDKDHSHIVDRAIEILAELIAFDTTSRNSNLDLIAYCEQYLQGHGAQTRRWTDDEGRKANLLGSFGPQDAAGGIVLSGHSDVVPVDGQHWTSPPFTLTDRGDRWIGRGTADMKGFIAVALAAAPLFARTATGRPLHIALSYDEEVGCQGAPAMIDGIAALSPPPAVVIVGEPSLMRIIGGHKGVTVYRVTIRGRAAHSSLVTAGVSANMAAVGLLASLRDIADSLERGPRAPGFEPGWSTLTIGRIDGGTAVNILAESCVFDFDLRTVPGDDVDAILAPFLAEAERTDAMLRARFPEAGVMVTRVAQAPPLAIAADGDAERIARRAGGCNEDLACVAYGTEAGLFQRAGIDAVICGPGSIEQAHKADEYVEKDQIRQCAAFMQRLAVEILPTRGSLTALTSWRGELLPSD